MRVTWNSGFGYESSATSVESTKEAIAAAKELTAEVEAYRQTTLTGGRIRYTQIRVRHVLGSIPTLVAVIAAATLLSQISWLSYGWTTLLGGGGNILTGGGFVDSEGSGSAGFSWGSLFLMALASGLFWVLPKLAEDEEESFRKGAQRRNLLGHVSSCLIFGLIHMIMGVSLAVGLALSLGGAYFTLSYLYGVRNHRRQMEKFVAAQARIEGLNRQDTARVRDAIVYYGGHWGEDMAGVAEATRAHLCYNTLVVSILWFSAAAGVLASLG